jgi:hypothetical protein
MWNSTTVYRISAALAQVWALVAVAYETNDSEKVRVLGPDLRRLENAYDRLVFGRQR